MNVRRILRGNRGNRREWEESTRKMLEKPPPISFLPPILFPLAWDGEEPKRGVQPEPGHCSSLTHKTTLQTMAFVSWRDSQNAVILPVDRAGGTDGDDRPVAGERGGQMCINGGQVKRLNQGSLRSGSRARHRERVDKLVIFPDHHTPARGSTL